MVDPELLILLNNYNYIKPAILIYIIPFNITIRRQDYRFLFFPVYCSSGIHLKIVGACFNFCKYDYITLLSNDIYFMLPVLPVSEEDFIT